jgi:hypothetical protein
MIYATESVILAVTLGRTSYLINILHIVIYYVWFLLLSVLSGMFEGRIHHLLQRKKPFGLAPVAT